MTGLARTLEPMHDPACPPVRLAEAAGVLSLATDLAMGQPLEHGLRTAIMALRTAQAMGLPGDDQVTVFYTGVLHFAGCTAESEIDARFFGDELAARPRMMTVAHGSRLELIATAMRVAHQDSGPLARAAMMARAAFGGVAEFRRWAASHCDVARLLGARLGLPAQAQQALRHLYERWDGNGMPGKLRGTQIPQAVRLMQVAQDADVAWQHGGSALVRRTLAERAGSGLDPQAVGAFLSAGDRLYEGLDTPSIWDDAMAAEPGPQPLLAGPQLDAGLSAIADFADLKTMWTAGHSRGVADLAGRRTGAVAGLAAPEVLTLRRAGLVHDIGRVAVPVSVWAKPGPLARGEHEAGPAARLSQRAGARGLPRAAPAGTPGRIPRRAVRRVRLPPGQPGRRPPPGCWRRRTVTTRCANRGHTVPPGRHRPRRTNCAGTPRPANFRPRRCGRC